MRKPMALSRYCPPCWRLLTLSLMVAFQAFVVDGAGASKMPELPRLSRRELLQHHSRLRKLSKVLRPDIPTNFLELTNKDVPVLDIYRDGNITFDRRKNQQVDGNGRPQVYYRYPVGANKPFTPLRFKFITDPLLKRKGKSNATDENIDYIINDVLPEVESVWDSYLGTTEVPSLLELDAGHCFGFYANDIAPQTIFSDVDLVLIISGYDVLTGGTGEPYHVCTDNTLVVGSYCAVEEYGRPIIGFLNFCLNSTKYIPARKLQSQTGIFFDVDDPWRTNPPIADEFNALTEQDLTTAAIHQLGHVLGMQIDQWKLFLNATGALFYTPQPAKPINVPCSDGTIRYIEFPASNTIQINRTSEGLFTFQFALPFTQSVARNHFNCQSLPGALLEVDPKKPSCVASHFNARVFFGELMQHLAYESYNAVSPMMLSVLYDSFWYMPFYREHLLPYGAGAGCEFANGASCIVNDAVPTYGKGFYCTNPIVVEPNGTISLDQNDILCDSLHQKWALCDLYNLSQVPYGFMSNSSSTRKWFSDKNLVSTTPEVDFCPMPIVMLSVNCNDSSTSLGLHYQGEVYGESSRCINAALNSKRSVPACFSVTCDAQNFRVVVNGITCKYDGEIHSIRTVDNKNATFECPRFATICPKLASCPSDCGGNGICDYSHKPPKCVCNNGVSNDNCQNLLANTFAPTPNFHSMPSKAPVVVAPITKTTTSASTGLRVCVTALTVVMAAIASLAW